MCLADRVGRTIKRHEFLFPRVPRFLGFLEFLGGRAIPRTGNLNSEDRLNARPESIPAPPPQPFRTRHSPPLARELEQSRSRRPPRGPCSRRRSALASARSRLKCARVRDTQLVPYFSHSAVHRAADFVVTFPIEHTARRAACSASALHDVPVPPIISTASTARLRACSLTAFSILRMRSTRAASASPASASRGSTLAVSSTRTWFVFEIE